MNDLPTRISEVRAGLAGIARPFRLDCQLTLTQTQTVGPVFKMPLDVLIETDLGAIASWFGIRSWSRTSSSTRRGGRSVWCLTPTSGSSWNSTRVWAWRRTGRRRVAVAPGIGGALLESVPAARDPELLTEGRRPDALRIFDASGRQVRTLLDGVAGPGTRQVVWDGRDDEGSRVPAGVYFTGLTGAGRKGRGG